MNPKTAMKWLEADQYCRTHPVPSVLAQVAAQKAKVAMRKAIPAKPAIRLPRGVKAKPKKKSIKDLKNELDRVFSIWIRISHADENGNVACITCQKVHPWKEIQNGHYQSRGKMATRWTEMNCAPQDIACNIFRHGEPEKFAAYIDRTHGEGSAAALRELAQTSFKLNRQWLEMKINEYKTKIGDKA